MLTIEEIGRFIDADASSERKRLARVGQRYYEGRHDILDYKLYYYDADGKLQEDKTRSNIKIPHPFFTELVDQCVQHMLSGEEPIVAPADESDKELEKALAPYFGEEFEAELSDTLTEVCICGFGYMYGYMSADGRTAFDSAETMGVVEVRAKDTDANMDHAIYWYIDRIDKGRKTVTRIQVHDDEEIWYYVKADNGQIALDKSEELNPRPHVVYTEDGERRGRGLGYVPFFRIDANRRQHSHLKPIKAIIDDYDLMSCGLSNNIQDVTEAVWVVKGFQGHSLDEMIQNIKTKKHVGVDEDGDVDVRTIDIPREARKDKLDIDEKNIYRFGMGLNMAGLKDTTATTNMAIKSAYALLELKCNKLEKQVKKLMRKLVKVALDEINQQTGSDYTMSNIRIRFERETMTNEAEHAQIELTEAQTIQMKVATLLNVASQYGNEALLEEICAVLDLDYEKVRGFIQEEPSGGLEQAERLLGGMNGDE